MEASHADFDIPTFKKALEEHATKENGWELVSDGAIRKDFPDCTVKVYKKKGEGDSVVTTRMEGVLRNVKIEKFFKIMTDMSVMLRCKSKLKQLKLVEQISKNSDIIYMELDLPFPLTNRDFLVKRIYFNNHDDPELVKKLGMYETEHKYFIMMQKSIQRPDYPPLKTPVRADTKLVCWIVEEDPKDKKVLRFKNVSCNHLNGSISSTLTNKLGPARVQKVISGMVSNYYKLFGRE